MSLQVPPIAAGSCVTDRRLAYAEAMGPFDGCNPSPAGSDSTDISLGELCSWATLAPIASASFGPRVALVVGAIPDPQVLGVDAWRIVTGMARHHAAGDFASGKIQSKVCCESGTPPERKASVSLRGAVPGPDPTRTEFGLMPGRRPRFVDPGPEACDRLCVHGSVSSCEPGRGRVQASRGRSHRTPRAADCQPEAQ